MDAALRLLREDPAIRSVAQLWPSATRNVADALSVLPADSWLLARMFASSVPYVVLAWVVTLISDVIVSHWVAPVFEKMLKDAGQERPTASVVALEATSFVPFLMVPVLLVTWLNAQGAWPRMGALPALKAARLCTVVGTLMRSGMNFSDAVRVARVTSWGTTHVLSVLPPSFTQSEMLLEVAAHLRRHAVTQAERTRAFLYAGGISVALLHAGLLAMARYADVMGLASVMERQ
ncbi:MAG: hypothetical protein AB2A00_05125 [Myxococcota bacterium]